MSLEVVESFYCREEECDAPWGSDKLHCQTEEQKDSSVTPEPVAQEP